MINAQSLILRDKCHVLRPEQSWSLLCLAEALTHQKLTEIRTIEL